MHMIGKRNTQLWKEKVNGLNWFYQHMVTQGCYFNEAELHQVMFGVLYCFV